MNVGLSLFDGRDRDIVWAYSGRFSIFLLVSGVLVETRRLHTHHAISSAFRHPFCRNTRVEVLATILCCGQVR
jgi:hypothetical protein